MQISSTGPALTAAVIALFALGTAAQAAGENAGHRPDKTIVQSVGPGVPVEGKTPPLQLTDDQRARIREVLKAKDTEVDLALKTHAKSKDFAPTVGEAIPKDFKGQAFPLPIISEIPATKQYIYVKFKGQVLVVNPMTKKIVDMFPEAKT